MRFFIAFKVNSAMYYLFALDNSKWETTTVMNGNISLKDNWIMVPLCGTFSLEINKMDKEIAKLHRAIYIWENIGIGINASIKEKEIATKIFLEKNTNYNFYQVCEVIKLNKGTYYHYINDRKNRTQYEINDEKLSIEIRIIYDETEGRIGSNKVKAILESKNIKASVQKVRELMKKMNLKINNKKTNRRNKDTTPKNIFHNNLLKRHFFSGKTK